MIDLSYHISVKCAPLRFSRIRARMADADASDAETEPRNTPKRRKMTRDEGAGSGKTPGVTGAESGPTGAPPATVLTASDIQGAW